MIEQLIAKVFEARNAAHLEHWRTKSYAVHKALGDFYEDVIELVDELVEAYQGNFGIIGNVPDVKQTHNEDCVACLNEQVAWIAKNRSKIAQEVDSLENIVDEITGLYLKTIYKLENLS